MIRRIDKRKERRKKFWMGALLAFLMVFSLLGIIIGNQGEESWEYNGYKFKRYQNQNAYITKIEGQDMVFNFLPQTLVPVETPEGLNSRLASHMMYFTFNPDEDVTQLLYIDTVRNDLQTVLGSNIVSGITNESDTYALNIITCENATPFVPVFYFNVSETTSIVQQGNCIVLNAQTVEFFKIRDLLIYHYYGVMDD